MNHRLPDLPSGIRSLTNQQSGRLQSEQTLRWPSPQRCLICRDGKTQRPQGEFRWYADGSRSEIVTYDCSCEDQWELHRFFLHSGIGLSYQRLSWLDGGSIESGGVDVAKEYLGMAGAAANAGLGLLFWGNTKGTGKTMLASLVLKRLVSDGYDGYFTTFSDLLSALMGSWNSSEDKKWFNTRVRSAGVLVVDDVGREMKQRRAVAGEGFKDFNTATSEFAIESVMRYRLANGLPTIITTNLSVKDLSDHYGGNFKSLLTEASLSYEFKGSDSRTMVARRIHDEVRQGLSRPVVVE